MEKLQKKKYHHTYFVSCEKSMTTNRRDLYRFSRPEFSTYRKPPRRSSRNKRKPPCLLVSKSIKKSIKKTRPTTVWHFVSKRILESTIVRSHFPKYNDRRTFASITYKAISTDTLNWLRYAEHDPKLREKAIRKIDLIIQHAIQSPTKAVEAEAPPGTVPKRVDITIHLPGPDEMRYLIQYAKDHGIETAANHYVEMIKK